MATAPKMWAAALAMFSLVCTVGCGSKHPNVVPVSGIVTIDGKPVTVGQVTFHPDGHRQAIGKIEPDGTFSMSCYEVGDGAPKGQHIVCVTAVEQIDERSNRWHAPRSYSSKASCDIRVTIDGPTDELEIKLTWDGSGQTQPYVVTSR